MRQMYLCDADRLGKYFSLVFLLQLIQHCSQQDRERRELHLQNRLLQLHLYVGRITLTSAKRTFHAAAYIRDNKSTSTLILS